MEPRNAAAARFEALRLLGIAEKLLHSRDLGGCKEFATLAQEAEPLLDGSDQILAVAEVLLAAEKRVNNHRDWYAVLQLDRRTTDPDIIRRQYRRLALLLHPDKNKHPFADAAFKLAADAWAIISDRAKKSIYDNELSLVSSIEAAHLKIPRERRPPPPSKVPVAVRRGGTGEKGPGEGRGEEGNEATPFWTPCPYCYRLYEYLRVYQGCCLRCQNCRRSFHAAPIASLPPLIPGKEAYYCGWAVFPVGFACAESDGGIHGRGFPAWTPPMSPAAARP